MWLITFTLAAILNAFMDTVEEENFSNSIFSKLNPKFWYKRESWKHVEPILGYRPDAWHLAKSLMILCLVASIILYREAPAFRVEWWLDVIIAGIVWNFVFWLFYHKIFER